MSYTDAKVKHHKLPMSSPVQGNDARGGLVEPKKSPVFGKTEGKGTKKHLAMEGPDLAGGGWVECGKKESRGGLKSNKPHKAY
jgi:hypothetical protein